MDINERFRKVRRDLNLNQKEFGDKLDMAQTYVSGVEKGARDVTEKIIKSVCYEYGVNYRWLKYGEGNMYTEVDVSLMAAVDRMMSTENEGAKRLFKAYAQLDESEWDALNTLIDRLANLKNKK